MTDFNDIMNRIFDDVDNTTPNLFDKEKSTMYDFAIKQSITSAKESYMTSLIDNEENPAVYESYLDEDLLAISNLTFISTETITLESFFNDEIISTDVDADNRTLALDCAKITLKNTFSKLANVLEGYIDSDKDDVNSELMSIAYESAIDATKLSYLLNARSNGILKTDNSITQIENDFEAFESMHIKLPKKNTAAKDNKSKANRLKKEIVKTTAAIAKLKKESDKDNSDQIDKLKMKLTSLNANYKDASVNDTLTVSPEDTIAMEERVTESSKAAAIREKIEVLLKQLSALKIECSKCKDSSKAEEIKKKIDHLEEIIGANKDEYTTLNTKFNKYQTEKKDGLITKIKNSLAKNNQQVAIEGLSVLDIVDIQDVIISGASIAAVDTYNSILESFIGRDITTSIIMHAYESAVLAFETIYDDAGYDNDCFDINISSKSKEYCLEALLNDDLVDNIEIALEAEVVNTGYFDATRTQKKKRDVIRGLAEAEVESERLRKAGKDTSRINKTIMNLKDQENAYNKIIHDNLIKIKSRGKTKKINKRELALNDEFDKHKAKYAIKTDKKEERIAKINKVLKEWDEPINRWEKARAESAAAKKAIRSKAEEEIDKKKYADKLESDKAKEEAKAAKSIIKAEAAMLKAKQRKEALKKTGTAIKNIIKEKSSKIAEKIKSRKTKAPEMTPATEGYIKSDMEIRTDMILAAQEAFYETMDEFADFYEII